ncbi:MAG: RNA polymerase sigma-70 factor [Bacteroidota bacterium]
MKIFRDSAKSSNKERQQQLGLDNSHALEKLYNLHADKLFRISLNLIDDPEAAKCIVHNVYTNLWSRRENLNITVPLEAYLVKAVKFESIDYLRAKEVREKSRAEILELTHVSHNDTEEQLEASDLKREIGNLVELLPSKCQQVFRLSREEFMSNREIAHGLNISEKTVERHMTKALSFLRSCLKDL